MDKTTADLLALAEAGMEMRALYNDSDTCEIIIKLVAELRRVTEPVTDAELAMAVKLLRMYTNVYHCDKAADVIERLSRENAELRKHSCDEHCSVCELTR